MYHPGSHVLTFTFLTPIFSMPTRSPVVSLQSRFATSCFAANRSRFAAHVKWFRFSEVVSLQSRFATELNLSVPKVFDRWNHLYYPVFPKVNNVSFRM